MSYSARTLTGKFAKLVAGRLYNVNGMIARFVERNVDGEYIFTIHKTFKGAIPLNESSKIHFATKAEVENYLTKAG